MSERFVIVHRSYDPMLIDHLGEMLRDAGIVAKVLGTRDAAGIGVGSSITELNISVPHSQAAEATDFLEAFFATEGEELLEREGLLAGDDDDDDDDDETPSRLLPVFAGVAVLFCGLGHIYARRRITGVMFVGGVITSFVMMAGARSESEMLGWGLAIGSLMALDFIGAQLAVRSYNRGVRRGLLFQLAMGAIYIGVAVGLTRLPSLTARLQLRPYPTMEMIQRGWTSSDVPELQTMPINSDFLYLQ